jgi:hypothetical protein
MLTTFGVVRCSQVRSPKSGNRSPANTNPEEAQPSNQQPRQFGVPSNCNQTATKPRTTGRDGPGRPTDKSP